MPSRRPSVTPDQVMSMTPFPKPVALHVSVVCFAVPDQTRPATRQHRWDTPRNSRAAAVSRISCHTACSLCTMTPIHGIDTEKLKAFRRLLPVRAQQHLHSTCTCIDSRVCRLPSCWLRRKWWRCCWMCGRMKTTSDLQDTHTTHVPSSLTRRPPPVGNSPAPTQCSHCHANPHEA